MAIGTSTQIDVQINWLNKARGSYAVLRWTDPNPKPGEPKRRSETLGYVSPEEAERARVRLESELRLDLVPQNSSSGYTTVEMLAEYLIEVEGSQTSKSHKDRVAGDCDSLYRHIGNVLVEELNDHYVKRFVHLRSAERVVRARKRSDESDEDWEARKAKARQEETGKLVSGSTIRGELATLRRAMKRARGAGRTRAHPLSTPHNKTIRRDKRPPRRLTEAEVRRLIAAAGELHSLLTVLAWSARRPKAIFALRVRDCSRVADMSVPRSRRLVYWSEDKDDERIGWGPVTEPTYQALLARLEELGDVDEDTYLWQRPCGKPWASTNWAKPFRRIAAAAGVRGVTTYDLRKHACSQIKRFTGSSDVTIEYSGHKSTQTLDRFYTYALDSAEEAASRIGWTPPALKAVSTVSNSAE